MTSAASASPLVGKTMVFVRTSSPARLPWYEYFLSCGVHIVVFEPAKKKRPEFIELLEKEPTIWVEMETNNVDLVEEKLRNMIAANECKHPDAVLSFDEYGLYPAALLAERMSCRPTPLPSEGIRNTHVKSLFREWCTAHTGIHSPKAAVLRSPEDDLEAVFTAAGVEFPLVLKPSPGAGSLLAKKCSNITEAREHAAHAWKELLALKSLIHLEALGSKVHIVAEEYIGGQEVDLDCVIEEGQIRFCAISDNFEVEPPYFSEKGGILPSQLPMDKQNDLLNLLRAFVSSHDNTLSGVLHFEAKYDFARGKPYVIEVNCRPGSAETDVLVSCVYGVPLGEIHTRLSLGLSIDDLLPKESSFPRGEMTGGLDMGSLNLTPRGVTAASVNMYVSNEGQIKFMSAPEQDPHFVDWKGLPEGWPVAPPPKMSGCAAWMVAKGPDAKTAKGNIDRLTKDVVIEVTPNNEA